MANEPYYIKSFDTDLDIKPMPPSVRTDKIINPAAPQPLKPTSSFPNLHKANVTNMINAKPKNKNIEEGKNNPKKVNDNIIKA